MTEFDTRIKIRDGRRVLVPYVVSEPMGANEIGENHPLPDLALWVLGWDAPERQNPPVL
jgi:hypothetical protein